MSGTQFDVGDERYRTEPDIGISDIRHHNLRMSMSLFHVNRPGQGLGHRYEHEDTNTLILGKFNIEIDFNIDIV
jgi:hypothetical protein